MNNQIIIGKPATGKSMNYVAPAIRLHQGRVLLISSCDEVAAIRLETVIDGNLKTQVVIDKEHSVADLLELKKNMHEVLNDALALIVFDGAEETFNDLFCKEAENIIKSKCSHLFVYQTDIDMQEVFTKRLISEAQYEIVLTDESKNYSQKIAM